MDLKAKRRMRRSLIGGFAFLAGCGAPAEAGTIDWSGYTWTINPGNKMGSGPMKGNPANVSIDNKGYLHLKISRAGDTWAGAELGTNNDFGFGTLYWVFSAPLTTFEPQVVLGGFTYGPDHGAGSSGENEIDIEFSKWNAATNANNADFNIFPATGQKKEDRSVKLWNWTQGTVATCRIDWSSTGITESVWPGVAAIDAPTSTAAITWTYKGTVKTVPQVACPMLFNLWTSDVLPTRPVDVVVEKFQYIASQPLTRGGK